MTLFRAMYHFFMVSCVAGAFLFGACFFVVHNYVIDFSILAQYHAGRPSILYDDEGNEWGRFQLDRRDPVEGIVLPQHLLNAFIAAEDWDFFSHRGISYKGIIRSIVVNIYFGRKAQGASTITQQLVKLLFLIRKKHLHVK